MVDFMFWENGVSLNSFKKEKLLEHNLLKWSTVTNGDKVEKKF